MMQDNKRTMIVDEYSTLLQNGVGAIHRHKKLIAGIFAVMLVLGILAALIMSDKYRAVSTVLVEDTQLQVVPDDDERRPMQRDELELQTQRELLLSEDIAKRVIEEMKAPISLSQYMAKLDVSGGVRSRILNISFEDKDGAYAAKIVNAHVQAYMDSEIASRKSQIASIKAKADAEIEALKKTRAQKSQLTQDLRQENDLIKSRGSEELIYEQISEISNQIPPIEAKKYAIQSRLGALNDAKDGSTVSDIVDSYLVQQLKVEESKRAQEYQLLKSDLGANNPDLVAAKKAWQSASSAVNREIGNIKISLENELLELERQEAELNDRLAALGDRANFQQGKMIKLRELELEEAASQKLLDGLLERYEEIQSQASFLQPKARLISKATAPDRPSGPNRPLIVIAALFFAGILSTVSVLFLELKDTGIRSFADIRILTQREPLGIVPKFARAEDYRAALSIPSNQEAIRKIVLKSLLPYKGGAAVMISSPSPKEGRSLFTAMIARYLALSGSRVLVVSMDFINPASPLAAGVMGRAGIMDILQGKAKASDLVQSVDTNLFYLPAGRTDASVTPLSLSENFSMFVESVRSSYDFVLIDAPPILAQGEIETLAGGAGGVILVTEWLKTKTEDLARAVEILNDAKANLIGVVINKVDIGRYKSLNHNSDFLLPKRAA